MKPAKHTRQVERRLAHAFDKLSCAHADLDEVRADLRALPAVYEGPVRAQLEEALRLISHLAERVGFTVSKPRTTNEVLGDAIGKAEGR